MCLTRNKNYTEKKTLRGIPSSDLIGQDNLPISSQQRLPWTHVKNPSQPSSLNSADNVLAEPDFWIIIRIVMIMMIIIIYI